MKWWFIVLVGLYVLWLLFIIGCNAYVYIKDYLRRTYEPSIVKRR